MAKPDDSYQKAEEAIVKSLSHGVIPSSSHSTAASSYLSFDSCNTDDSVEQHQHVAKTPFRNKTEQLKDHSDRGRENGSKARKNGSSSRRRSRSRNRRRSRSRSRPRSRSVGSVHSDKSSQSRSKSRKSEASSGAGRGAAANPKNNSRTSDHSKSNRSERQKNPRDEKRKQQSSRKLQTTAAVPPFAILPPPDPSSSSFKNINLLVCTANLGNAAPDADSWNAWIPKDGKLVATTQFPVRMNPPPPPPGQPTKQQQQSQGPESSPHHFRRTVQRERNNSMDMSSQPKPRKPMRRSKSKDPIDSGSGNTLRKLKKEKTNDTSNAQPEPQSYEAYLESLKGKSYSFDQAEEDKTVWRREKQSKPRQQQKTGDRKAPRRSRSNQSGTEEPSPTEGEKLKGDRRKLKQEQQVQQHPTTPTQLRRGIRRGRSNNHIQQPQDPSTPKQRRPRSKSIDATENVLTPGKSDPSTPKQRKPRSKSIDATKMDENFFAPGKSPRTPTSGGGSPNKTSPGMLRRIVRTKSSGQPQTPNLTPNPRKLVVRSKSIQHNLGSETEESPHAMGRRGRMRSKSPMGPTTSSRSKSPLRRALNRARSRSLTRQVSDGNSTPTKDRSAKTATEVSGRSIPDCRRIIEAEIPRAEVERIRDFDVRYPESSYSPSKTTKNPNQKQLGFYDIIVIGMQEATFSTSEKNQKQSTEDENQRGQGLIRPAESFDTADDISDSDDDGDDDDDSNGDTTDDGSIISLTDDIESSHLDRTDDEDDAPSEEYKNSKAKKKKKTRPKKAGRKSGLLKKISKATSKTAKTIDTFAGGGKNHTARPLRASPPLAAETEEGETTATLHRSETYSSIDTDDDELFLEEGNNGKENATSNTKKWTDTDVLHHDIESNQLPGYTRALSYQFGQMRLFVYYKPGKTANDLLQSLDVLSVGYQATGKAGLANKGGIVAEIAVNKTTKLSFLTAHLEAHEGAKHYRARNHSLQDILMEAGNSKYFDASLSSHFTFAMGDLNYRTKLPDVAVGSDRHIQFSHNIVDRRDWRVLNQYDELIKSLSSKLCLSGFRTAYCNFPPTFKVSREPGYLYNPARSPSYTDRILFKNGDKLDSATKLLLYEPVEGFTTSDHKPIRSGFSIRLNRELKWKSTAELLLATEAKTKSLDDLDGIIPSTSKGDIDADRETMNFFITNIECVINPSNYDQIRKQDMAGLPNPKVFFIANPSEAVVLHEDSGKKRRFGIGSRSKSSKETPSSNPGESAKKKDTKLPSTPTSKDTMRPIWKDDHIYFGLHTHTEHGRPIDFTGAQLHISLVDTKNSNSVIGSHCLNLAQLLIQSREKSHKNPDRSEQKRLQRVVSKHRLGSERQGSQRRLSSDKQGSQRRLMKERPASQRRLSADGGTNNEKGKTPKRGGPNSNSGYQLVPKPSPAMRAAAASSMKFGTSVENSKSLPPAVKKAAEVIHRTESGASKLYESIMADLGGGIGKVLPGVKNDSNEFGFRSLRLQETLVEGGLVTGHIKCDIDVWWT